jgi:hypothetical protein
VRHRARFALPVAAALLTVLPAAASAAPPSKPAKPASVEFTSKRPGEALLDVRALAPGTDWQKAGAESAVVRLELDGHYNQDVVLFEGAQPFDYKVALGPVGRGRHEVKASFDPAKSPAGASGVEIRSLTPSLGAASGDDALAQRYSPVVYGRDLGGPYENNHTDVPLETYHEVARSSDGRTTLQYTVIWSNEDGGTNTPALMARWGRTTDIEWIYSVTLDAAGKIVSESYQSPNHGTQPFTGARLGDHPMLETGTLNNNMLQVDDPATASGYRFIPDTSQALPAGRAREAVMDANPWTYLVMAKEMIREGKVEEPPSAATPAMSDQRDYLWAEIDKDTSYPAPPSGGSWVGTALQVRLAGDPQWYTSNHDVPDWSIQRDDPAATTVELPPGRTAADVQALRAVAVPVASGTSPPPADYRIDVRSLTRTFFLGTDFLPGSSFAQWQGDAVLTPANPTAVIWSR